MAFVQVGSSPIIKLDNYKEGELVLEGVYIGSFDTQFNQPAFKFREKGGTVRAVACGSLKHKMADVEKGSLCRIVYLGKSVLERGPYKGRAFHDVDLLVDDASVKDYDETEDVEEQF